MSNPFMQPMGVAQAAPKSAGFVHGPSGINMGSGADGGMSPDALQQWQQWLNQNPEYNQSMPQETPASGQYMGGGLAPANGFGNGGFFGPGGGSGNGGAYSPPGMGQWSPTPPPQMPGMGQPQPWQPSPTPGMPNAQAPNTPQAPQMNFTQPGANPYLDQQANAITDQVTNNLQRRILPGINSGSLANNNFGSNRHAIAQGLAIGDTNTGLAGALANMRGNAYTQDQQIRAQQEMAQAQMQMQSQIAGMNNQTQRDLGLAGLGFNYWNAGNQMGLQSRGMDLNHSLGLGNLGLGFQNSNQNYNLGLGNLALGNKQADQGFYTQQRGQDLQQIGLGSNLFNQGNMGLQQGGQGLYNMGQQQMQNSWMPFQNFGQMLGQFSGLGGTNNTTQPGGSQLGGAIGGAMTLAQLWKLLSGG